MKRGKIFITLLFVVLGGVLISTMTASCKNKKTGGITESAVNTESVIKVSSPPFKQFVVVTTDEASLYKKADTNSATLVLWIETDCASDYCDNIFLWSDQSAKPGFEQPSTYNLAFKGRVFPLLGEEGDFYKVYILNEWCDIESAYIPKACAEYIEYAPFKADMLEAEDGHLKFRVMKDGKYKDIVLIDELNELGDETFEMGVLNNGIVTIPIVYNIFCFLDIEQKENITIEKTKGFHFTTDGTVDHTIDHFLLKYTKSLAMAAAEDYESYRLDLTKLSDEQIAKIIDTMTTKEPEYVYYMYHFPALGLQSFYLQSFYYKEK